jgi:hypothetical protein
MMISAPRYLFYYYLYYPRSPAFRLLALSLSVPSVRPSVSVQHQVLNRKLSIIYFPLFFLPR